MHLWHPTLNRLNLGQKHKFKKIIILLASGPLIVNSLVNNVLQKVRL